ncbi:TMEM1 family protein-like protein [Dendryphion nanum]|uniref:TMEM1 family protein-like protein n=1 Tax=Dendryphion nanum TaxID=256645 RepID=A0A9P9DEZ3_9PLEO|nr:TMEM1 family protein-like protein [Dendryphion nanum]
MSVAGNGAPSLGAAEDAPRQQPIEASVMDGLSSSKVTVEYHDPSGLFPLIQEQLTSRFPLRNLHWKSPNRPLRSIDSLHVDLVPSQDTISLSGSASQGLLPPPSQGSTGSTSAEIFRAPAPSKERRHQIPGLRQTPYLKVYLLRCDDSDSYKSTARKNLREWVKTHTPPSQSSSTSSTENHDAFEWIIIHVVIPDTPASSQPRGSSSASNATGEKEKSSGTSRWTRGTSTILEKIRADFNISSKSGQDRVAQIRLQKDVVPPHMIPTASAVTSPPITESPQEQERVWGDLIVKFKTLILLSFDLRVSQYEEDIREKDAQRVLPGWNFCTFFILKEGLARGFESVGLVEDALLGYDELSIGLESVVREQASTGDETHGGVILSYTEDLYDKAAEVLKRSQKDDGGRKQPNPHIHDSTPFDSRKKRYRDLILSNNISVFDFRCYIFARQMSLLLRLGNAHSSRTDLAAKLQPRPSVVRRSTDDVNMGTKTTNVDTTEDLTSLAALCSRSINFITFAGRLLREDLVNGSKAHDQEFPERLIDNLVRSWTFAALQQILDETATSSLPITKFSKDSATGSSDKMQSFGKHSQEQKLSLAEPKTMIHPARSSSLSGGRSSSAEPPYNQPTSSGQVVYADGQYQEQSGPRQDHDQSLRSGLLELAGYRAQLHVIQRRILEHVGKLLGWSIGWGAVLSDSRHNKELSDVDLDDENSDTEEEDVPVKKKPVVTSPTVGLSAATIVNALTSIEQFRQIYEALSDIIVKHYMAAGQTKAAESILGDLAALRFELGDYAAASMYFGRMASFFAESRWNLVESTMLKMHAQCLKKLNRKDEYVRKLLDLLAKSAANMKQLRASSRQSSTPVRSTSLKGWLDDDNVDTTGLLRELVEFSEHLPYDISVSMPHYFSDISVEPYVRHYDDRDGFQLRLQFRHLLEDDIEVKSVKVRLIGATADQWKEIWLESSTVIQLRKGVCRAWLGSNVNATGPYIVDKVVLEANRVVFVHEPFKKSEAQTPLGITTSVSASTLKAAKKSRILSFPRMEAFQARLYLSHFIHIDQSRSIEIECSSGWNNIQKAEIRLKAASAGLRLRSANATVASGDVIIDDKPKPGVINISELASNTTATIKVPYELEGNLPELSIRLEIDYLTDNGPFQYHSAFIVPIELPLDVNVHDHFKNESLYSKFNIKTAGHNPLRILEVDLEGSEAFDAYAPKLIKEPVNVFPKQPLALTYKITTKTVDATKIREGRSSKSDSLALSVRYRCFNEEVLERLRTMFAIAVEQSEISRLGRLLIATFVDRMEHRVLPQQYERIALLNKVDLGPFEDIGWSESIDTLPEPAREEARTWVHKWHETHRHVLLPITPEADSELAAPPSPREPRRIIITVSIPQTHIVNTAALVPQSPEQSSPYSASIAVAGQPFVTQLRIKHTRKWGSPSSLISIANLASQDDPIEFVYAIEANPEVWLVAGQRRAHFTAKEGDLFTAPIMLVPLKTGNILMPNVEIRPKIAPRADPKDEPDEPLSCETDYLNYGECVMVVPDVQTSTVGIGDLGSPKSTVWLESEGIK